MSIIGRRVARTGYPASAKLNSTISWIGYGDCCEGARSPAREIERRHAMPDHLGGYAFLTSRRRRL
jgi:hypothetical protein